MDSFILKLLDIYPLKVPTKGGFANWVPDIIFITSNMAPPWTHGFVEAALKRRLSGILHFLGPLTLEVINQWIDEKLQ